MKKIKIEGLNQDRYIDITPGKIYNVIKELETFYTIKDDVNDDNAIHKSDCEEVKEPNYVMVRDSNHCDWVKKILLHDLGEQFRRRHIVVMRGDEELYLSGENNVRISSFAQMKPINEVEQKIEDLEQKLAELKQQINK